MSWIYRMLFLVGSICSKMKSSVHSLGKQCPKATCSDTGLIEFLCSLTTCVQNLPKEANRANMFQSCIVFNLQSKIKVKYQGMEAYSMKNPASKILNRRFLKKKSLGLLEYSSDNNYSFSRKAAAIKNKSVSALEPTRNLLFRKKFVSKGVMTDQNQHQMEEKIRSLTIEKEDLAKKLQTKRSQVIELNLKYLGLKEKYDNRRAHHQNLSNISDFGDISNISTSEINITLNNTSISKKTKADELAAIKARLQRLNLKEITERSLHEEVLPKDL